jgi:prepilin-type N-terminal cleavage/methylation domain-containing protein
MRDPWSVVRGQRSAPASRIPHRASRIAGFTFIEVIVALAVTAILVATVCATLVTALSAERRIDDLRDAEVRADDLASHLFAGLDATHATARWAPAWIAAGQPQDTGAGTNFIRWSIWEIRGERAPDGIRMALRTGASR